MSEEPPKEIESSPFDEFSQFEASNSSDSKKIKVIYTFGEKQHGIPTYLDIKAKSDAKIKDFVGLSLYKYQQNGFKPEAKPSVKLYKLYLADDIYSYDTDLPPLDGNRYLKDIDFPFLALVEEDEDKLQNEPNSYSVQVYFVDGTCIDYDLDDTDITLGWLKTDALMKREEKRKEDGDKRHQAFDYKLLNYRIELYEVPDKALNESASVASAGSRTFVIIRQNSGRGAFDIKLTEKNRNSQYSQQSADFNFDFYSDKPLYVETRAQPIFHNASKSRSQSDEMEPNQASTSNSNSLYGQTASLGQGNVLETFFVERLHRLKPKWTAKLTFRDDCLSLIPVEEDRRRSTQSHPHKSVTISWDLVGGIDYYHTSPSKRSLKIIWLPMPPELFAKQLQCLQYIEYLKSVNISTGKKSSKKGFTSSSSSISLFSMGKKSSSMKLTESHSTMTFKPDDKSEMRPYPEGIEKFQPKDLIHGYERLSWKTLNIETTDDEAWKIGEKLSDIIDQRKSPIRQIFQHSNSGEHRPSSAAETAFRLRNLSYISQNIRQQDEASSSGHKTHRRRFSVNPMPMLNKILSRNE